MYTLLRRTQNNRQGQNPLGISEYNRAKKQKLNVFQKYLLYEAIKNRNKKFTGDVRDTYCRYKLSVLSSTEKENNTTPITRITKECKPTMFIPKYHINKIIRQT